MEGGSLLEFPCSACPSRCPPTPCTGLQAREGKACWAQNAHGAKRAWGGWASPPVLEAEQALCGAARSPRSTKPGGPGSPPPRVAPGSDAWGPGGGPVGVCSGQPAPCTLALAPHAPSCPHQGTSSWSRSAICLCPSSGCKWHACCWGLPGPGPLPDTAASSPPLLMPWCGCSRRLRAFFGPVHHRAPEHTGVGNPHSRPHRHDGHRTVAISGRGLDPLPLPREGGKVDTRLTGTRHVL